MNKELEKELLALLNISDVKTSGMIFSKSMCIYIEGYRLFNCEINGVCKTSSENLVLRIEVDKALSKGKIKELEKSITYMSALVKIMTALKDKETLKRVRNLCKQLIEDDNKNSEIMRW